MDLKSLIFEAQNGNDVALDEAINHFFDLANPLIKKYEIIAVTQGFDKEFIRNYILHLTKHFILIKYNESIEIIDNYFCGYLKYSLGNFMNDSRIFYQKTYYYDEDNERHQCYVEYLSLDECINENLTLCDMTSEVSPSVLEEAQKVYLRSEFSKEDTNGITEVQKDVILDRLNGEKFTEIAKDKNLTYNQVIRQFNIGIDNLKRSYYSRYYHENITF